MKNRKNAFTLVELLAVIAILALIGLIAIPKVLDTINNSRNKGYLEIEKRLEEAASKYILNEYIDSDTSSITITKEQLISEGYIEEIYDLKDNTICDAYVYVSKLDVSADFYVNVNCDSYVSEEKKTTVIIYLNNGDIISNKYIKGEIIDLETPIKENFMFVGWEVVKGDSLLENGNKLVVGENDTIVYALWQNNELFEVDLDGGIDTTDYNERYLSGEIIQLEVPTKKNYSFKQWEEVEGNGVLSGNTYTMGTEKTVLKAIWELDLYKLTVEPNGGNVIQQFKSEYAVGETITLEPPIRTGYTFDGWTAINGTIDGNTFTMGTSDAILTANWNLKTINVTFNKNDGSGSTVSQVFNYGVTGNKFGYNTDGTAKWGTSGDFGSWTRTGYRLLGWSTDASATEKTYNIYSNVTDNWIDTNYPEITLYAVWEELILIDVPSQSGTLTYSGSAQSPSWSNYNTSQLTLSGTTSGTNAGSYSATFTPKAGYAWKDKTTTAKTVSWSIGKAAGSLTLSASSGTITTAGGAKTFTVTRSGDGKISVSSSNTGVATVSVSGTTVTVKAVASGTATITVSVASGTNHNAPSNKTYTATVNLDLILVGSSGVKSGYTYSGARNTSISVGSTSITSTYAGGNGSTSDFTWSSIDVTGYTKMTFTVSMSGVTGSATFKVGSKSIEVYGSGTYSVSISGTGNQRIEFETFEVGSMKVTSWKLTG